VLQVLNDVVRRELDASYQGDERFLTVAYLVVKPGTGGYEVKIACGGHPYPVARRADGTVEEVPCEGDLIGAFEVHEATDRVVELSVDDALVLVTDGVLEARHKGVELGEEGLRQLIAASTAADASGLADEIEQAVLAYLGGNPKDDLAIVVLRMPEVVEVHSSSIDLRVADLT
jgi:serine phosphatase RsbU (regulator of sigma subunit)